MMAAAGFSVSSGYIHTPKRDTVNNNRINYKGRQLKGKLFTCDCCKIGCFFQKQMVQSNTPIVTKTTKCFILSEGQYQRN